MVVPTRVGNKTNDTQPEALAGDWSRRSATAPIQTSTRLGQQQANETDRAYARNRPSGFAGKGYKKCQSTVTLVRPVKYETTK